MKTQPTLSHSANAARSFRPASALLIVLFLLAGLCLNAQPGGVLNPNGTPSEFGETFYIKQNARNRKPTAYVHEREADVMWSKRVWRTIDLREKFNHPMYYPEMPLNDRKSLFDVIKSGLLTGDIYAFDNPFFDDEFKVRMTKKQIEDMMYVWDSTRVVENPDRPGEFMPAPIMEELTARQVKQYWVKEDWFFDKQRSVMDVRILGLCPLKEKIDPNTGEMIGVSPLFWVYFPQCRPFFAQSEVYNTKNDSHRNTFDDLFQKRMFQSFVRKESNVFDREINAYTSGLDALLEAERVKDELAKIEHDVWHF